MKARSYATNEINPNIITTTDNTATTAATCFSVNPSSTLKVPPKSRVKRLPELECSTNGASYVASRSGSGPSGRSRRSEAITTPPLHQAGRGWARVFPLPAAPPANG
jgi:hypothetical protein